MVDVKIPKHYTIQNEEIEKYFVDFLIERVLYCIAGYMVDRPVTTTRMGWLCKYFWDKINGASNVIFYTKEAYNNAINNGKKQFKDTELIKYDWVVFIDKLYKIFSKTLPILYTIEIPKIKLIHLEYCEFVKNREIINEYKLPIFDLEGPLEQIYKIISKYMEVDYSYDMVIEALKKRRQELLNYWEVASDELIRFNQTQELTRFISQLINLRNLINNWTEENDQKRPTP